MVARATTIPIATGERLTTKYEFARVLETGAASILQLALGRVGGILEAKKIAGMAEAHYAQIAPHLYCGPIEGAANIQLAACSPNFLILESIQTWGGFHAEILQEADRAGRTATSSRRPSPASASSSTRRSRPRASLRRRRSCISRCTTGRSMTVRLGFIGLGHLGGHLAGSLLRGGFDVTVHDLDRARAERPDRGRARPGRQRRGEVAARRRRVDHLPALARGRRGRGRRRGRPARGAAAGRRPGSR